MTKKTEKKKNKIYSFEAKGRVWFNYEPKIIATSKEEAIKLIQKNGYLSEFDYEIEDSFFEIDEDSIKFISERNYDEEER